MPKSRYQKLSYAFRLSSFNGGENMENYDIDFSHVDIDNDTELVTSFKDSEELIRVRTQRILSQSMDTYDAKRTFQSSVFTSDSTNSNELTVDYINQLATGINSTLDNVLRANEIILKSLNTSALFGLAYSILYSNINTNYRLVFNNPYKIEASDEELESIKNLIEGFNHDIDLEELIRDAISGTYVEGNYNLSLSLNKGQVPQIRHYPLAICYPSYYMYGNDRVLEFNINDLKNRIKKTYSKNKKNKAIYYDNIEKEIKDTYPDEVYSGYKSNDKTIRLDPKFNKCLTINSFGRRFGVSPFFKALKSSIVLDNIIKADISYSKSRAKIIIFQKLSDKLLGKDGKNRALAEQALAHTSAASALQTSSCLYTAPAYVENLSYVTPKNDNSDSVDLMKQYTTQLLNALGISFLDVESATGTSVTVSFTGLLRIVNSIANSLAKIISRFYQEILEFYGYNRGLAPTLRIETSEELDLQTRMELAKLIYSTFNGSAKTAFEYIGLDVDDEVAKRKTENDNGVYDILLPRQTSYTVSGNSNESGRPSENQTLDDGKQDYDKDYNKNARSK